MIGAVGTGAVALPGLAAAGERNTSSGKPDEDEAIPKSELGSFDDDAETVSKDELPLDDEEFRSDVGTMDLPECKGIPFEGVLEGQVCPRDDGSLEISIGALGVVADTLIIDEGEATKTGGVNVAIPALPGSLQEFSHEWNAEWSSSGIDYLGGEVTLEAWQLGEGWFEVASADIVVID